MFEVRNSSSYFNRIETREEAAQAARGCGKLLLVVAAVEALLALLFDARLLIEATLYASGAYLVLAYRSRAAAVVMTLIAVSSFFIALEDARAVNHRTNFLRFAIVLWASLRSVQATFKFHRLPEGGAPTAVAPPLATAQPPSQTAIRAADAWRGTPEGRQRRVLWVLVVLVGAVSAAALLTLRSAPSADLDALQGEWVLERCEEGGRPQPWHQGLRLTITGNEIQYPGAEDVRFRITPEKSPPWIDIKRSRLFPQQCLYRLEGGDQWVLCANRYTDERPKQFTPHTGGTTLCVFRRVGK